MAWKLPNRSGNIYQAQKFSSLDAFPVGLCSQNDKGRSFRLYNKNSRRKKCIRAIEELTCGKKYICDEIKSILSDQLGDDHLSKVGINSLSSRELEIIEYIKKRRHFKEIAAELNLSPKTVEIHRYNIS